MFPNVDSDSLRAVSEIANLSRTEAKLDSGKLSTGISTRTSVELAGLLFDGFTLNEAAEVTVYPQYVDDGVDSERTFVKQLVQKYINDGTDEYLFNENNSEETA